MFDCPNCGEETRKLIGSSELNKVVCPKCYTEKHYDTTKTAKYQELTWKDGNISRGKAFEMDNRVIAKDGTVVNKLNGRRAER